MNRGREGMLGKGLIVLIAVIAMVLQLSFLPGARLLDVVPNLMLVVIAMSAAVLVASETLILAAVCGLMLDISTNVNFGLWTGVLILVVLVGGFMMRAGIELEQLWVQLALVAAATIVMGLSIWISLVTHGAGLFSIVAWIRILITELVLNLLLVVMLRPLAKILWRRSSSSF